MKRLPRVSTLTHRPDCWQRDGQQPRAFQEWRPSREYAQLLGSSLAPDFKRDKGENVGRPA